MHLMESFINGNMYISHSDSVLIIIPNVQKKNFLNEQIETSALSKIYNVLNIYPIQFFVFLIYKTKVVQYDAKKINKKKFSCSSHIDWFLSNDRIHFIRWAMTLAAFFYSGPNTDVQFMLNLCRFGNDVSLIFFIFALQCKIVKSFSYLRSNEFLSMLFCVSSPKSFLFIWFIWGIVDCYSFWLDC